MAENKIREEGDVAFQLFEEGLELEGNKTFQLARRFADPELASKLDEIQLLLTKLQKLAASNSGV